MDNYNFYTTGEDNKTLSEDSQQLLIFMLGQQKIAPGFSVNVSTSSFWLREEYQEGKVMSKNELCKIINKQEKKIERKSSSASFWDYLKGVVSDSKIYWTKEDSVALSKIRKKSLQRLRKLT